MKTAKSPLTLVFVVATTAAALFAQSPVFEVASVKLSASGEGKALVQAVPGRLLMRNFALRRLIIFAYGSQDYQIVGDLSSIDSERFDIEAKTNGNATVQQMEGPMLQALLEDRFHLRVHREIRQLPVYELTAAKGGVKMQSTKEGSCVPYSVDQPPPANPAPGGPRPVFCGYPKGGLDGLNRTLDGAGISMADLGAHLSRAYASDLNRNVIDKTGLSGTFDIHLKWALDAPAGAAPSADSTGPSLFTALQEQLGLKLESARGPVEVLVIDHVEKPSEN